MVRAHHRVEAGLLGVDGGVAKVARVGLLVLSVEPDDRHGPVLPLDLIGSRLAGTART
jgi:hypothetical protein